MCDVFGSCVSFLYVARHIPLPPMHALVDDTATFDSLLCIQRTTPRGGPLTVFYVPCACARANSAFLVGQSGSIFLRRTSSPSAEPTCSTIRGFPRGDMSRSTPESCWCGCLSFMFFSSRRQVECHGRESHHAPRTFSAFSFFAASI